MNEYELTVLFNPKFESDLEPQLETIRSLIKDHGGTVKTEDNWGKKRLQYSINKEDFAVYVYMELELPASAPQKINASLNITDSVLRYLLVKTDPKAKAAAEAAKAEADESEEA